MLVLAICPSAARACAVCGAAEKTLPVRGEEIAFAGGARPTLAARLAAFAAKRR